MPDSFSDHLITLSRAGAHFERSVLGLPSWLRLFSVRDDDTDDAIPPELRQLWTAAVVAVLAYVLVFNPLTELLFPFPGATRRLLRVGLALPAVLWALFVVVSRNLVHLLMLFVRKKGVSCVFVLYTWVGGL
jgi:hypothetical protein